MKARSGVAARVARSGARLLVAGGAVWLGALALGAYNYLRGGWDAPDDWTINLGILGWVMVFGGTVSLFGLFALRRSIAGGVAATFVAVGVLFLPAFFTGALPMLIGAVVLARLLFGWDTVLLVIGSFVVTLVFTGLGDVGVVAHIGLTLMGLGWVLLGLRLGSISLEGH